MKANTILGVINRSLMILEKEVGLAQSSLKVIESRSFRPISEFFDGKNEAWYSESLISELEELYRKNLLMGVISRNVYNLRIRGTMQACLQRREQEREKCIRVCPRRI